MDHTTHILKDIRDLCGIPVPVPVSAIDADMRHEVYGETNLSSLLVASSSSMLSNLSEILQDLISRKDCHFLAETYAINDRPAEAFPGVPTSEPFYFWWLRILTACTDIQSKMHGLRDPALDVQSVALRRELATLLRSAATSLEERTLCNVGVDSLGNPKDFTNPDRSMRSTPSMEHEEENDIGDSSFNKFLIQSAALALKSTSMSEDLPLNSPVALILPKLLPSFLLSAFVVDTLSQRQLLPSEAESKSTHRKTFLVPPGGTQVQEPSRTVEHVEPQHKLRKTTCKGHYGYGGFKLALTSAAEAASHLRRLAKIHSLQLFSASEPKECQEIFPPLILSGYNSMESNQRLVSTYRERISEIESEYASTVGALSESHLAYTERLLASLNKERLHAPESRDITELHGQNEMGHGTFAGMSEPLTLMNWSQGYNGSLSSSSHSSLSTW